MYGDIWSKKILASLWSVRFLLSTVLLIIVIVSLVYVKQITDEYEKEGKLVMDTYSVGAGIVIAICGLSIILDIIEIVLFTRKKFGPIAAVVLSSSRAFLWLFLFIMLTIGAAARSHSRTGLSFFFIIVIVLNVIAQLVYTSVVLHRHRKGSLQRRGTYELTRAEAAMAADGQPHASYDDQIGPLNPFRDPSREPSPNPHDRRDGSASEYYDGFKPGPVYELQARTTERYA